MRKIKKQNFKIKNLYAICILLFLRFIIYWMVLFEYNILEIKINIIAMSYLKKINIL